MTSTFAPIASVEHFQRICFGVYSAAGAATEATIIQEDDYRPPFPVGGGVSDSFADNNSGKDLHTRG
jgi:hypothetical protein